jgi:hypothetical protein
MICCALWFIEPEHSLLFLIFVGPSVFAAYAHDTGIDSGLWDNVFDDGSPGTKYIASITSLPQYHWSWAQPDDYGAEDQITPITLTE